MDTSGIATRIRCATGPQVLAAAATGVIELIETLGGDPDRVFGQTRLRPDWLENPFNELNLKQYCELFERAAAETRHDNFGLHFGQRFRPQQLGALGYLAINSPTMAAALANLTKYFTAHQQNSTLTVRNEGDLIGLEYQITDGAIAHRRQDAELSLGMFCNVFRHCHGQHWAPVEVHFEHPHPAEPKEHEQAFGAPVFFGQRTNSIIFRRADLAGIMPSPDPYLLTLLAPFMRDRQATAGTDDLVGLVRQRIQAQLAEGSPNIRKVADDLGMTSWTLYRRLREHQVSFNELVRDARREMALRYVAQPHLALTEVALMLGYSELSAFSRAFRQWTGVAPARYRRESVRRQGTPADSA